MAEIIKVIERTLAAGATTLNVTDAAIPNSIIGINCSSYGLYPSDMTLSGTTLTITYDAQPSIVYIAILLIKSSLSVIDALDSESETNALSAKQGKTLKDLIDSMSIPALSDLTDVNISSASTDDILIYDGVSQKWINTSFPSIPSDIDDLGDVDIVSPYDDDVLTYDNGVWVNKPAQSGSGINYSTSEVRIGTWTDGKPLYQITKTLTTGIAINTYGTIDLPSGVVVRDLKGYIYRANYESVDMFNGYINNGQIFVTIRNGDIQYMISNVFSDIIELDITVQYTKTSD